MCVIVCLNQFSVHCRVWTRSLVLARFSLFLIKAGTVPLSNQKDTSMPDRLHEKYRRNLKSEAGLEATHLQFSEAGSGPAAY